MSYEYIKKRIGSAQTSYLYYTQPASVGSALAVQDAYFGITDAGAGAVSAWADQSSNANNATQGTANRRPTYSATLIGGAYPGLQWTNASANNGLTYGEELLGSNLSFTVIGLLDGLNAADGTCVFLGHSGTAANKRYICYQNNGDFVFEVFNGTTQVTATVSFGAATRAIYTAQFSNGNWARLRVNSGSWTTTGAMTVAGSWQALNTVIGALRESDYALPWKRNIGFVGVWPSVLSDAELGVVEEYVRAKWNAT